MHKGMLKEYVKQILYGSAEKCLLYSQLLYWAGIAYLVSMHKVLDILGSSKEN